MALERILPSPSIHRYSTSYGKIPFFMQNKVLISRIMMTGGEQRNSPLGFPQFPEIALLLGWQDIAS